MGLLSRLLGSKKELSELVTDAVKKGVEQALKTPQGQDARDSAAKTTSARDASGSAWDVMPSEPCQYNYPGTYMEYFTALFQDHFAEWQPRYENVRLKWGARKGFVFTRDGVKVLVVELLSEKQDWTALRNECARQGIPYLRFYYDHRGWWNTRSYVLDRVSRALGI